MSKSLSLHHGKKQKATTEKRGTLCGNIGKVSVEKRGEKGTASVRGRCESVGVNRTHYTHVLNFNAHI